ncbi:hypothetical protein GTY87_02900 [Streptomyces sp. SID7813]|uniref:Uncharacterized protein n=2 Tax=Streptomyces TaxID=1883 RepID=Q9RJP7_STRCO|nr:hypothetical protein [Streptomyces sp. SID7813]NSL79654.1 hypothetical protein [Streptomyces coelicolor]QFI40854.1 hypothetical protein FQ762_02930 [Streptomyces coelicolor A3(2)]QKN64530.1 hypothetical protein HCU77_02750 [Streptomyces coelicolor]CAB61287.1 hypothetical protein SCF55.17c [Streptomyces coelicolor A3(2)]
MTRHPPGGHARRMARFQHTVTLAPVPRRWFESCVAALHDLAEGTDAEGGRLTLPDGRPLPGLVLAEGRHPEPGARYRPVNEEDGEPDADQCLTVLARDRRGETALEVVTHDDDPDHPARLVCALGLTSVERPREAWLTATLHSAGGKRAKYLGGTGRLRLDLGRWWQATSHGRHSARAPLGGTLTHALVRVSVTVVPRPAPDGRWRVTVKARIRGRSFARPLLPLAAAVLGRRARRAGAEALERAAVAWNAQVPALVRKDGERLSAELADALLGP